MGERPHCWRHKLYLVDGECSECVRDVIRQAVLDAAVAWLKSRDWAHQNPKKLLSSRMTQDEAAETMREYFSKEYALKDAIASYLATKQAHPMTRRAEGR